MRNCVIVGVSAVTALGETIDETFANIQSGKTGIREVEHISTEGCYSHVGAEVSSVSTVKDIIEDSLYPHSSLSKSHPHNKIVYSKYNSTSEAPPLFRDNCGINKYYHILGKAISDALADAKLKKSDLDIQDNILINATCSGDSDKALTIGPSDNKPILHETFTHWVYIPLPSITVSTACSSGLAALSMASNMIRMGKVSRAVIVGADIISDIHFAGFNALRAMDTEACKPFSNPNGLTLGDGASAIILEAEYLAHQRNANIYCYVSGSSITTEASHITTPDPTGDSQLKTMQLALRDAGKSISDIDFIYAHGTGTPKNDEAESKAIEKLLATSAKPARPYVGSSKSAIGHTLGASGLINTALAAKMFEHKLLLPTVGFEGIGINNNINYKSKNVTLLSPKNILCNAFAFGGHDTSLILSRKGRCDNSELDNKDISVLGWDTTKANFINNKAEINVDSFKAEHLDLNLVRKMDGYARMKCLSGIRALRDAGIKVVDQNRYKIGIFGISLVGTPSLYDPAQSKPLKEKGNGWGDTTIFPNSVQNAGDGWLSICTGIKGYSLSTLAYPNTRLLFEYIIDLINANIINVAVISSCNTEYNLDYKDIDTITCNTIIIGKNGNSSKYPLFKDLLLESAYDVKSLIEHLKYIDTIDNLGNNKDAVWISS